MTTAEGAKVKSVCKEVAQKFARKEMTQKEFWDCVEEIQCYKTENNVMDTTWNKYHQKTSLEDRRYW